MPVTNQVVHMTPVVKAEQLDRWIKAGAPSLPLTTAESEAEESSFFMLIVALFSTLFSCTN